MKSRVPTASLISLALLAGACSPGGEQPVSQAPSQLEDVAAIKAFAPKAVAATNAGDAAALADLYTEDAIHMSPNQPALVGRAAIQSSYQAGFDQLTQKLTLSLDEVGVSGDWAFSRGTYTGAGTPKAGGGPVVEDNGKFLAIHKRQPDGAWKIHRDIANSDRPFPGGGE